MGGMIGPTTFMASSQCRTQRWPHSRRANFDTMKPNQNQLASSVGPQWTDYQSSLLPARWRSGPPPRNPDHILDAAAPLSSVELLSTMSQRSEGGKLHHLKAASLVSRSAADRLMRAP